MITLTRPAYYDKYRYAQYCGLEKDDKSIISASNGDEYYEIDTAKFFRYNKISHEWIEQPSDAAPIDTGLPPMTSETVGHFLSNDGLVTKWQPVASKNFIIGLTANNDGSYTSDKTFVQIKTAYDEFQNIAIRYNSAQMPLMNVEFADNGNAVFLFGHVEIQTGGQRIVTRAIQYSHDLTSDNWTDLDRETDMSLYLLLSGGHMEGELTLAGEPTDENHAANKQYVDTKVAQTGGNISGDLMVGGSLTINGIGSMMGTPIQNVDLVNKGYLDASISDVIRKSSVTVGASSSVNVPLSNGAYLLTVSDDMHGGLVFVSVYPSGETINGLVNLNNWKCERISSGSGVTLTNSTTSAMIVYITSIGEGTYR